MLVIGDVHGCYQTLLALFNKIPSEHKQRVCFAGDLIDRGPNSRQVVEFVMKNNYDCVAGNHEEMMLDDTIGGTNVWMKNGGDECMLSYRIADTEGDTYKQGDIDWDTLKQHKEWMQNLPSLIEYPDVLTPSGRYLVVSHSLCHNYLKNYKSENKNRAEIAAYQIKWNRSFHKIKDQGFFNVIGHTPEDRNPHITKIYANIDTGAFCGLKKWKIYKSGGLGKLTALHVPTMTVYQQECIDD